MKNFKVVICLLFIWQNSFSQCDLIKPKDDFSTTKKTITQDQKIIGVLALLSDKASWDLSLKFADVDGALRIILTHQCDYNNSGSGIVQSIFFKFKNDSIIKKYNRIFTQSVREGSQYFTYSAFLISKDELESFSTQELDKVRVKFYADFDYPEVDAEIKKKFGERVKKNANCLFVELK